MIVASIGKLILRNKYIFTFSSYVLMLKKKVQREGERGQQRQIVTKVKRANFF